MRSIRHARFGTAHTHQRRQNGHGGNASNNDAIAMDTGETRHTTTQKEDNATTTPNSISTERVNKRRKKKRKTKRKERRPPQRKARAVHNAQHLEIQFNSCSPPVFLLFCSSCGSWEGECITPVHRRTFRFDDVLPTPCKRRADTWCFNAGAEPNFFMPLDRADFTAPGNMSRLVR